LKHAASYILILFALGAGTPQARAETPDLAHLVGKGLGAIKHVFQRKRTPLPTAPEKYESEDHTQDIGAPPPPFDGVGPMAPPPPGGPTGIFNGDKMPIPGKTPAQVGAWVSVPSGNALTTGVDIGAQAIQAALLPNGLILVVNGSSNRENISPLKITDVQNTVLFNPKTLRTLPACSGLPGSFNGLCVPATPEPQVDANQIPNGFLIDPFCGGQNHLPDGRVLFIGGTKRYDSQQGFGQLGQGFLGTQEAWIFDWTKIAINAQGMMSLKANPWTRLTDSQGNPPLRDGRWYPAVVTMGDGKLAIWGGYTSDRDLDLSTKVEIFDPSVADPRQAWTSIDWQAQAVRVQANAVPTDANNGWSSPLDLYPRVFLMPDGRFFLPGDGVGNGNRHGHTTFYAQLDLQNKRVIWDFGDTRKPADRPSNKFYATALHDPRASIRQPGAPGGNLLVIGGGVGDVDLADGKMPTQGNPGFRANPNQPDRTTDNTRVDLKVSADLQTYDPPALQRPVGRPSTDAEQFGLWRQFDDFLGPGNMRAGKGRDGRMNHMSVILPTGEILVVGGGSYGYGNPHFFPMLLTPQELLNGAPVVEDPQLDANMAGFRRRTAAPHQFPRLYHTNALLIPDGRVVLMGGNPYRTTVVQRGPRGEIIPQGLSFQNEFNKGFFADQPSEEHLVEIYQPPYLFRGARPVINGLGVVAASLAQSAALAGRGLLEAAPAPAAALPLGPTGIQLVSRRQLLRVSTQGGLGNLAKARVTLVKLGAPTHSTDVGQKFIQLQAQFAPLGAGTVATVSFPNQVLNNVVAGTRNLNQVPVGMNTAPVGTYMLFVINDQNVPSEAAIIELTN
jgi:hypothetical protein